MKVLFYDSYCGQTPEPSTNPHPQEDMAMLGIDKGDYVEGDVEARNIVLKPRKLIDPSQGWYWTREWQEMEARVDEEIENDLLSPGFETAEQGLKWLQK